MKHGLGSPRYDLHMVCCASGNSLLKLVVSQMVLPISVEDVKREVKILSTLTGHENVVQFYAAYEDDDYVYIVME